MVTPLPEANARTNTALGYKQTGGVPPPKTNNMMLPSTNGGMVSILAASSGPAVQSRHSDRRDSN